MGNACSQMHNLLACAAARPDFGRTGACVDLGRRRHGHRIDLAHIACVVPVCYGTFCGDFCSNVAIYHVVK